MKYKMYIYIVPMYVNVVLFSVLSCSFDYSRADLAEGLDSEIPDIQMEHATLTYVRGTIIVIDTKELNIFSDYDRYDVADIEFREMSKSGEIRMLGEANKASINTQNNDVALTGNIWVRSHKDEAEVKTEFIEWKDNERIIQSNESDLLTIERDDGSKIQGYGFVGDADSRNLTLENQVVGELVVEEDDEVVIKEEQEVSEEELSPFDIFDKEYTAGETVELL